MRSKRILRTVVLVLVMIQGCAPGYNSVLFATRSNLGFDADTTPPNLEIAISRLEGVLEPTFEGGQTLPVMASFSSRSNGVRDFFWGVNSTFSTGEAAFTMSYLYDDDTPCKATCIPYERVTLEKEPDPKELPFGCKVDYIHRGNAKPVLFGTDTILGIKIKWSGETAQYPSAVNIGFKRKEATLAPIAVGKNRITDTHNPNNVTNKPHEIDMPSLLATLETDVDSSTSGPSAGLKYLQYFATGSAANNLARRHAVRLAMIQRANPPQAKIAEELRPAQWNVNRNSQWDVNRNLIDQITDIFNCADVNKKNTILAKAKTLKLVDEKVTMTDFPGKLTMRAQSGPTPDLEALKKEASAP